MQLWPGQYSSFAAVTPSDTTLVNCRALYVGGAGNVTVKQGTPGAAAILFTAPPVGTILPLQLDRGFIMATGTTATVMVALS